MARPFRWSTGFILLAVFLPRPILPAHPQTTHPAAKAQLPPPLRLGSGSELRRDPETGELRAVPRPPKRAAGGTKVSETAPPPTIRTRVTLVEVNCVVAAPDGTPLRGLRSADFRVYENGVAQSIAHFDDSTEPASIALVIDVSPSEYRELDEMRAAARTLAAHLAPEDEVAVVAFAGQADLLLPFTRDRRLLERALASAPLARVANSPFSNIYRAVFLAAQDLFPGRSGRKAVVLLTDGQDSGLGLSWESAGAGVIRAAGSRLTFEDVVRLLGASGIEVYAISTQPRPRAMSDTWLAAHRDTSVVAPAARDAGIPVYTAYLAELVRRAGGQLYFLRDIGTLADVYRRIAETLRVQYTLGYYPSADAAPRGWRSIRVELAGHDARITHRAAYYISSVP